MPLRSFLSGVLATVAFMFVLVPQGIATEQNPASRWFGEPIVNTDFADMPDFAAQAWHIEQLASGEIIVSSTGGLHRFNGESWSTFTQPQLETRYNDIVRAFVIDEDGTVYTGVSNELGFYQKDQYQKYRWHSLTALLPDDKRQIGSVWSITRHKQYVVYGASKSVWQWNGQSLAQLTEFPNGVDVLATIDGEILTMAYSDQRIYQIIPGEKPKAMAKPWKVPNGVQGMALFKNQAGNVVLVTARHGVFELQGDQFLQVISPDTFANKINLRAGLQDQEGYYYFGSVQNGLFLFDRDFNLLRHYGSQSSIYNSVIYDIHQDNAGNIWLAGEPGVEVFRPPYAISQITVEGNPTNFVGITEFKGETLVFADGIYQLIDKSPSSPEFVEVLDTENVPRSITPYKDDAIVSIDGGAYRYDVRRDDKGRLQFDNGIQLFDKGSYSLKQVPGENAILFHSGGVIWVLNEDDAWSKTELKLTTQTPLHFSKWEPNIGQGNLSDLVLWAHGFGEPAVVRLSGFDANFQPAVVEEYRGEKDGLGKGHALSHIHKGNIIFTTTDGIKIFDKVNKTFVDYQGVPAYLQQIPNLSSFVPDDEGRVWFRDFDYKNMGIINTNNVDNTPEDVYPLTPFYHEDIQTFDYANSAMWAGTFEGNLYQISKHGINQAPEKKHVSVYKVATIEDSKTLGFIADNHLSETVPNTSNSIRIHYALPDYSTIYPTQYRTKIIGGDKSFWTAWSTESHKDFPLLPGGDYRFEVEAKDPWGRLSNAGLNFTVEYPWYLKAYALIAYTVVLAIVVFILVMMLQQAKARRLIQKNRELEALVHERTQEVEAKVEELEQQQALKDRFFANVSHEFRTPLTLTINPLEALMDERHGLRAPEQKLVNTALDNAKRLWALVGQVLDMNRLDAGKLILSPDFYDLLPMLKGCTERFQSWSRHHGQTLTLDTQLDTLIAYCDIDQLESCIANLLSNAIKYSGDHCHISISTVNQQNRLGIVIEDDGVGLTEDAANHIFDRYYRDTAVESSNTIGSGIGLSLVQEIMSLHNGEVTLESVPGQGCKFTLWLPIKSVDGIDIKPFESSQGNLPEILATDSGTNVQSKALASADESKPSVLIIEDNTELRHFLSLRLSASYRVFEAEDGDKGYACAMANMPDLIISDINMPGMNGFEVTEKLKSTPALQHIPIILLTAKATKRDTVTGFQKGADDYVTKPFDMIELMMRINSLLEVRRRAKLQHDFENVATDIGVDVRESFARSLSSHIAEHLGDHSLSVETTARSLNMSTETLTRRCKQELNATPAEYITQVKMEKAKALLASNQLTISEVAYSLGYKDLAYFSRVFRKNQGESPSQYRKKSTA